MKHSSQPQVKLNGIEYLLISIQSNPGKSQRWHLRRKYMYQHGRPSYNNGGTCCGYFTNSHYRDVVWYDSSPKTVIYEGSVFVDGPISWGNWGKGKKSKCSQMHLTRHGWERANKARQKIGLDELPFPV